MKQMEIETEEKPKILEGEQRLSKISAVLLTTAIYSGFFILGVCVAMPGLTLPELQQQVQLTSFGDMAYIYTVKSGLYLVGCFLGGLILEKWNKQLLMSIAFALTAVGMVFVPWSPMMAILLVCMGLTGLATGFIDTGGNVTILVIWQEKSGPYMQALHFLFGVGAFAGPVLIQPFTENIEAGVNANNITNGTGSFDKQGVTDLEAVYPIVAGLSLFVSLSFLVMIKIKTGKVSSSPEKTDQKNIPNCYVILFVSLMFTLMVFYSGLENCFGQFALSFAMNGDLQMSKIDASYIAAVFWGSFTVGRFLAIFIASKLAADKMILIDLLMCAVASVLALFSNHFTWTLWIAAALNGLGQASVYASIMVWTDNCVGATHKITAALVTAGALGEMCGPSIVAHLMDGNPMMLIYFMLVLVTVCILLFASAYAFSKKIKTATYQVPPEQ